MPSARSFALAAVAACLFASAPARAAPWFDADADPLEDAYADGEFDGDDPLPAPATDGATDAPYRGLAAQVHGESWVGLAGFVSGLRNGKNDVGATVVVGLALDRLFAGPVHGLGDPAGPGASVGGAAGSGRAATPSVPPSIVAPGLAHGCVAAAWRASGLGEDDARIDGIVARARASAILPETRLRAMRLWTDASHATTLASTDATDYYAAVGANFVLEARLTWRLDRLVYAGDEPTLERVRLERVEARSRLAERALQGLFAWARARADADDAPPASREAAEALLRAAEAAATLDVLTGGWFSANELPAGGEDASGRGAGGRAPR